MIHWMCNSSQYSLSRKWTFFSPYDNSSWQEIPEQSIDVMSGNYNGSRASKTHRTVDSFSPKCLQIKVIRCMFRSEKCISKHPHLLMLGREITYFLLHFAFYQRYINSRRRLSLRDVFKPIQYSIVFLFSSNMMLASLLIVVLLALPDKVQSTCCRLPFTDGECRVNRQGPHRYQIMPNRRFGLVKESTECSINDFDSTYRKVVETKNYCNDCPGLLILHTNSSEILLFPEYLDRILEGRTLLQR